MPKRKRDVPWFEWRDNGVGYAYWYDPKAGRTQRQSLDTRDPGEAARRFGEFLLGESPELPGLKRSLGVTPAIDDYMREHVEALDDAGRPRVVDVDRQMTTTAHLRTFFDEQSLLDIGPRESRAYAAWRRGGGVKDSTIRRELVTLVAVFNHAVKWGRIPADTRSRIELVSEARSDRPQWLTKQQVEWAFARSDGAFHAFLVILYYTAARRRAVENLVVEQVDLEGGRIDLMPLSTPRGTSRHITTKVTGKRKPIVPIYPEMREEVEWRVAEARGGFLFPAYSHYARWFTAMMKADFGIEAHPHMLRHSRATHMLQDGEKIYKVARLLGDTVATVERVYGHASPDFLQTESGVGA